MVTDVTKYFFSDDNFKVFIQANSFFFFFLKNFTKNILAGGQHYNET